VFRNLFQTLVDHVPLSYKTLWKLWYDLAVRVDGSSWNLLFMNFGFASLDGNGHTVPLNAGDEVHRWCIQQYLGVLADDRVEGRDLLEVGCGRGGGAAAVMSYSRPRTLAAIDLSAAAIAMARERIRMPGLTFLKGSADRIPFPDGSFDGVLNVESSHCYPDVPAFLSEVRRVLKPGGRLYWTDFRKQSGYGLWKKQIAGSGMRMVLEEDIRPNVLRALDLDSERKQGLLESSIPRPLRRTFRKFACLRGSENYLNLSEGRWVYIRFVLEKDGP
jgi:ubiquinone/menaquinone biosynthesis C-methylase UbiE